MAESEDILQEVSSLLPCEFQGLGLDQSIPYLRAISPALRTFRTLNTATRSSPSLLGSVLRKVPTFRDHFRKWVRYK